MNLPGRAKVTPYMDFNLISVSEYISVDARTFIGSIGTKAHEKFLEK